MGGIQERVLLLLTSLSIPHLFPLFKAYFTSNSNNQPSDKWRNYGNGADDDVTFSSLQRSSPPAIKKTEMVLFCWNLFYSE